MWRWRRRAGAVAGVDLFCLCSCSFGGAKRGKEKAREREKKAKKQEQRIRVERQIIYTRKESRKETETTKQKKHARAIHKGSILLDSVALLSHTLSQHTHHTQAITRTSGREPAFRLHDRGADEAVC
jgi:hypothetical protein